MERRIITTEITEEDKRIEPNLRPMCLAEYIGQEKIRTNLKVYIDAAMFYFTGLPAWERRLFQGLLPMKWEST